MGRLTCFRHTERVAAGLKCRGFVKQVILSDGEFQYVDARKIRAFVMLFAVTEVGRAGGRI